MEKKRYQLYILHIIVLPSPSRDGGRRKGAQLIIQLFRHFTYVTAHSPTLPSLYLRHSSLYNLSVTSPTSQLILQPFRFFTYVTAHSPTLLSPLLRHRIFTYVTWRAAHTLWLAKRLSLNLNFSFLNRISLLLISSSYPIVLTRLGGPLSRPYTSRKISRIQPGIEPGTSWMAVRRANHYTKQVVLLHGYQYQISQMNF